MERKTKIGVITFHKSFNYGAVLQAYALRRSIERLGFSCDVVDYLPRIRDNRFYEKTRLFSRKSSLKSVTAYFIDNVLFRRSRKDRYTRFRDFIDTELSLSPRSYRDAAELAAGTDDYDAFVCGSDQVWNLNNMGRDDGFFLNFVPEGKRRISYAPSFGFSELKPEHAPFLKESLERFSSLSVREKQGRKIIAETVGRGAEVVLDPTFLLSHEEWSSLASSRLFDRPYILCYMFGLPKRMLEKAREIGRKSGYAVVFVDISYYKIFDPSMRIIRNAGPKEFLSLFEHASLILTTSFHGTAFALNFRKPFFVQYSGMRAQSHGSRIVNLLETAGLTERLCDENFVFPDDPFELDYSDASKRLEQEIERSKLYLQNALDGSKGT